MSRRSKPKQTKRDWRWYLSLALNGAVALSMVLGTVFVFGGMPTPQAAPPTPEVPTIAPTAPVAPVAPTAPPPTPTPQASADAVTGISRDGEFI